MTAIPGFATEAGTQAYRARFPQAGAQHFRQRYGLWMGSIGLGAFLGAPTQPVSRGYQASVAAALAAGCNVLDTAPSYRHLRSQQDVGAALAQSIAQGVVSRDQVIVCAKGGYLPFDWPGAASLPDVAGGIHSLHPEFLSAQIEVSLETLGLAALDLFYVQEPEIQLNFVNPGEFLQRMRRAFAGLEQEVQAGRIRFYGVSSTHGLLADPAQREHLPLYKLVQVAEAVAGASHHFRFLQFPYHLGLTGAMTQSNQMVVRRTDGRVERRKMPVLAAGVQMGMVSLTCGGLAQGLLAAGLGEGLGEKWAALAKHPSGLAMTSAQAALHFARSTPGLSTVLVGMGNPDHVIENLALASVEPVDADRFFGLLG